jgi:hypothetical protein
VRWAWEWQPGALSSLVCSWVCAFVAGLFTEELHIQAHSIREAHYKATKSRILLQMPPPIRFSSKPQIRRATSLLGPKRLEAEGS